MKNTHSSFNATFFSGNRRKLCSLINGTAPIIISGNGLMQRSADDVYRFRQDSNFWYLTGIDIPGLVLVIDKDLEYLIIPDLNTNQKTFDGEYNMDKIKERSGISEIYTEKGGWKKLRTCVKKAEYFASLPPPKPYIDCYGMFTNPARYMVNKKLRGINPDSTMIDVGMELASMRSIKQPQEIAAIKTAIRITENAVRQSLKYFNKRTLSYEYELEALISKEIRFVGASGYGYDPIIASGPRTSTLHYQDNNHAVGSNDLILFDVGASYQSYTADITRVVSYGDITTRQQRIWDSVVDVQNYAMSILKPAVSFRAYENDVMLYMGQKLAALGLIKKITSENIRQYFPHAVSHSLGLDVHDLYDDTDFVKEGMVLQIEPGIYIPDEQIGMRIEDAYLITKDGAKKMSNNLCSELNARKLF